MVIGLIPPRFEILNAFADSTRMRGFQTLQLSSVLTFLQEKNGKNV